MGLELGMENRGDLLQNTVVTIPHGGLRTIAVPEEKVKEKLKSPSHTVGSEQIFTLTDYEIYMRLPSHTVGSEPLPPEGIRGRGVWCVAIPHGGLRTQVLDEITGMFDLVAIPHGGLRTCS